VYSCPHLDSVNPGERCGGGGVFVLDGGERGGRGGFGGGGGGGARLRGAQLGCHLAHVGARRARVSLGALRASPVARRDVAVQVEFEKANFGTVISVYRFKG
jgi:hypothetical protein